MIKKINKRNRNKFQIGGEENINDKKELELEARNFLRKWYSHPTTQSMLNEIDPRNYEYYPETAPSGKIITDNDTARKIKVAKAGQTPINYVELDNDTLGKHIDRSYDPKLNEILINKDLWHSAMLSTLIHEGEHAIQSEMPYIIKTTKPVKHKLNKGVLKDKYLDDIKEIRSRIMEARHYLNLNPDKRDYTPKEAQEIQKQLINADLDAGTSFQLERLTPETMADYLNYLANMNNNNEKPILQAKLGTKKTKKIIAPNIIRGGAAIPLGDNIYLLKGKKHSQGGIDIGKDLEAEGDEVVKMNPKSIKVVTAQKIMGGKSPAELVVNASSTGEQEEVFNDVFKYQEKFKDRNGLNDDGTKKAEFGKEVKDFNNKMLYNPKKKKEIKIQPPLEIGQKHLKQRNYIGGKPDEARRKALNMMPKVKSHIEQLAKTYGIDKDVLTHRFIREGWVDNAIKEYNNSNSLKQKEFFDKAVLKGVNGFESLGLDDAATLIDKGKYNLRKELPFWVIDGENEKGRKVWSIYAHDLYDALEFKAADMEYRQNELRKRGISEEDINTYLNAAYNMGLYHKDLNNKDYINKNYKVPNYYKLGGMKQFKNRKKAAGGGAWASLIGEYGPAAAASTTQLINAGLMFPVNLGSVIGANVYTKKQLDKIKEATLDYNTEVYDAQTKYNKDKYNKLNELLDKYYKEDLADLEKHKIVRKDAVYSPVKLKTRININPQLQQIQRERDRNIRSIVENTASSKDALNRIRLENLEARDKNVAIQGQKENIETQLINQDLLQRKATMEKQVEANLRLDELRAQDLMTYYNNLANLKKGYNQNKLQSTLKNLEDVFNTENLKRTSDFNAESSYRQGRMENRMNLIQGISDSFGQFFNEVNNSAMTAAKLQTMQDAYGKNKVKPQTSFSPVGIQDPNSQYFGNSGQNSVMTKEQFDTLYNQILSRGYNLELGKMGGKFKVKRRNK